MKTTLEILLFASAVPLLDKAVSGRKSKANAESFVQIKRDKLAQDPPPGCLRQVVSLDWNLKCRGQKSILSDVGSGIRSLAGIAAQSISAAVLSVPGREPAAVW